MEYLKAFLTGGLICCACQLLIDKTALTPARILTGCVVTGVLLGALGLYPALVRWAGAGATVPLTGFGNLLAEGTREAVEREGLLGALTGPLSAASGGVAAAVLFGALAALLFSSKEK
ncbi:MAG: stage V sporulation protein AE [Oscillospiraceae bacterium]|nr:stage V sporulation protein AE [Oscillospiraceae bacterium]